MGFIKSNFEQKKSTLNGGILFRHANHPVFDFNGHLVYYSGTKMQFIYWLRLLNEETLLSKS